MIEKLRTIFQVPELRRRILFTLALFVIYRLGEHMPTARRERRGAGGCVPQSGEHAVRPLPTCSWVARSRRATVFALGIMPYISASIILQLLGAVGALLREAPQGSEEGQKQITQ